MKEEILQRFDKLKSLGVAVIIHSDTRRGIEYADYYKFYVLTHWNETELITNLDEKIRDIESKPWLTELKNTKI